MARGWESKAVEDQQLEALAGRDKEPAAVEEPVRQAERASILLARSRALADLQLACAPAHRAMLERAIQDLEARLAAMG